MNNPLQTSLTEIAKHDPCREGWDALLKLRGHEPCDVEDFKGDDTLFNVSEIGKLENVDWLCWTARLYKDKELDIYRHFVIWCAMRVEHLMEDERSKQALKAARDYLEGKAPQNEAFDAHASAVDAALDATAAADAAARAAARAAACAIFYAADDSYRIAIINEQRNQLNKLTESLDKGVFEYENSFDNELEKEVPRLQNSFIKRTYLYRDVLFDIVIQNDDDPMFSTDERHRTFKKGYYYAYLDLRSEIFDLDINLDDKVSYQEDGSAGFLKSELIFELEEEANGGFTFAKYFYFGSDKYKVVLGVDYHHSWDVDRNISLEMVIHDCKFLINRAHEIFKFK